MSGSALPRGGRGWIRFALAYAVLAALYLLTDPASAQNTLTFDVDFSSQSAPVASWSTTPEAATCTASGDWSGDVGPRGQQTLGAVTGSFTYAIECSWPGDSISTVSWTNPTENTDGSSYDNPQDVLIFGSSARTEAELGGATCEQLLGQTELEAVRLPDETMHTFTGLAPGTYNYVAFARNAMGLCSAASNTASSTIQGSSTMSDSISGSVPGAIGGLAVE